MAFCYNGTDSTSVVLVMGKLRNRDSGWPHYWNVNSKQADPKACFINCFSYCYFKVHGRNSWQEERFIWDGSVRGSIIGLPHSWLGSRRQERKWTSRNKMSPKTHSSGLLSMDLSLLSKSLGPSKIISLSERTKCSSHEPMGDIP